MANAKKSDPDLWEDVKDEFMQGDKGGEPGQWSARKAQLAVQEYKRRGGSYDDDGPDQGETDLNTWTEQDWGTRSGQDSSDSGERYLPRKARMILTADEYRRSTKKKRADTIDEGVQFSDQPADVKEKVAKIRKDGPTREMLMTRARDLDIDGRSNMNKRELLSAIDRATDDNGRKKGSAAALQQLTRDELYARAQQADIDGRSSMSKQELLDALVDQTARESGGRV